ncbi:MAG: glutamine-hydrolyzing carbamoyl-phosphate synthase small subunit [Deltaproteobacteria bacterium]|nr:glutamine-hydrolyzing carbamoyl-phosphate synthase small subunit [Deltaproteobacteria bacterium]MBI3294907.1 glutamine-hydrolyzing carbamoyl-phosphate synthase small subunit [Deltaproteobacteria bacterium]
MSPWTAALYLENGQLFVGKGFGAKTARGGEAVFNTGMTGYQEIYTDPSYYQQVVVLTGSEVGNTGVNADDIESTSAFLSGVVVREYNDIPSNWRSTGTLSSYLDRLGVPGVFDIDTREVTRVLRDDGAQRSIVFPVSSTDRESILKEAKDLIATVVSMEGLDLVSRVSCQKPHLYGDTSASAPRFVVYDYGVKTNILRSLRTRGFGVQVVPYNFPYQEVMKINPQAVLLSNGPGDPSVVPDAVGMIQGLLGKKPIFAICMGHQLLARALGCTTYKLKFGHHGINHPVKDCIQNKILITSQNHGFAVKEDDLASREVKVSHKSLNDGCVEGYSSEKLQLLSVQFHPEARPGPSDAANIFDHFVKGFIR